MFKPKSIKSINFNFGCHVAAPMGDVKYFNQPIKLLHYKRLGLDYFLNRMAIYKKRISDFNKKNKLGFEYAFQKEEHSEKFLSELNKKDFII